MSVEQITRWDADWSERFPVRVRKEQKERFLQELQKELQERSFETERLDVRRFLLNRLLATKCARPKVILLAHYDTPTIMPFWISTLFRYVGHTRQIAATLFLIVLLCTPLILSSIFALQSALFNAIVGVSDLVLLASFIPLLIPNPHNREDNTSGVLGLMALADWLKDKPNIREHVQLIFLDNEELGLLGSSALKRVWDEREHPYADASIISLDCISRGQKPLVVYHRNEGVAQRVLPYLQGHLPDAETFDMKLMPLSDNYVFRRTGAIDISFADPTVISGGYYIPRIHSPSDIDFSTARFLPAITGLTEFLMDAVLERQPVEHAGQSWVL